MRDEMLVAIERVKQDLPRVKVQIGRKVYLGRVSGRKNPFATVSVSYIENETRVNVHLRGVAWQDWQFSWEQVARAVKNNTPLLVA